MIPTHIILHHSLTEDNDILSWSAIRRYHVHELGWNTIGYHFGIELVGDHYEILCGRMLNVPGVHCSQQRMNYKSVGICLVGNFDKKGPESSQLMVGKNLIRSLMETLNIPKERIFRHSDFADYKTCPGKLFPFDEFIQSL
jgi:hypothetical protein